MQFLKIEIIAHGCVSMAHKKYQGTFDTRLVWYLEMCPISISPLQTNVGKFFLFETMN
jgi:hypothetical protein